MNCIQDKNPFDIQLTFKIEKNDLWKIKGYKENI